MLMLDKMEELNMTQKQLAELMGCSQQYVSKVLKGQENLSLDIIQNRGLPGNIYPSGRIGAGLASFPVLI